MTADSLPQSGTSSDELGNPGLRGLFARAIGCSRAHDELVESVGNALFGETRELGRYRLGPQLGSGGFGVVRAAHDPLLQREVAIKLLRRRSSSGTQASAASLAREARSLARVRHPNVVEVFDVGVADDDVFIVMQRIDGVPLGSWLARERPSVAEIVEVFREAGEGLAAIHACGLLHRDFKPANLLIGPGGSGRARTVKIVDFGLAELLASESEQTTGSELDSASDERPRQPAGTPLYMSPEQHLGRRLDARTDVYAFSLALLEALLGHLPFRHLSLAGLLRDKQAEDFADPEDVEGLPPAIARAIVWGLRADPRRRCPSMAQLLAAFDGRRERSGPLRAVGTIAALAVLLLGTTSAPSAMPCDRGTATTGEVDSPWAARRAQLVAQLGAGAVEDAIVARVDDWGQRWSAARSEACDADPTQRQLVQSCLDDELAGFVAGLDALPQDRPEALAVLAEVPDPAHCRTATDEGRDPELDDRVQRARLHLRAGDLAALAVDVEELGARVDAEDAALLATLEHWRSQIARRRHDLVAEREHLERSYALARGVRSDALAHRAALQLAAHHAVIALDEERAEHWLRLADAIAPVELGAMMRARRLHLDVRLAMRSGEYRRAISAGELALAELEGAGLLRTPLALETRNSMMEAEVALGRFTGLEPRARAALAAALEVRGPGSYEVAHARVSLGRLLASTDRLDEARREFELARDELVALGQPLLISAVHNALAHVAAARGDLPAAIESYRAAMESFPAAERADRGLTLLNLAAAEIFVGRLDDGEAHLERGARELEGALDDRHPWRAHVANERANLAAARETWRDAARLAEEAAEGYARHYGAGNWMAADAWSIVAQARLEQGDPAGALEALGRTEHVDGAPDSLRVGLAFLRARVLARLDRMADARAAFTDGRERLATLDATTALELRDDVVATERALERRKP